MFPNTCVCLVSRSVFTRHTANLLRQTSPELLEAERAGNMEETKRRRRRNVTPPAAEQRWVSGWLAHELMTLKHQQKPSSTKPWMLIHFNGGSVLVQRGFFSVCTETKEEKKQRRKEWLSGISSWKDFTNFSEL